MPEINPKVYPRLATVLVTITYNATPVNTRTVVAVSLSQIRSFLASGETPQVTLPGTPATVTATLTAAGVLASIANLGVFDNATEELSIAGILAVMSANVRLEMIGVAGWDMGVGVKKATTAALLAEIITVDNAGRIQSLANPTQPKAFPMKANITLSTLNEALTGALEASGVYLLFWITPKEGLK